MLYSNRSCVRSEENIIGETHQHKPTCPCIVEPLLPLLSSRFFATTTRARTNTPISEYLLWQVFFRLHLRFVTTVTRLLSPKVGCRSRAIYDDMIQLCIMIMYLFCLDTTALRSNSQERRRSPPSACQHLLCAPLRPLVASGFSLSGCCRSRDDMWPRVFCVQQLLLCQFKFLLYQFRGPISKVQ